MYKINQKVFIKTQGNYIRGREQEILEGFVTKVGRKYVTVNFKQRDMEFHIENGWQKTEWCKDFQLYPNKQAIVDELEYMRILKKLRNTFSGNGTLNLEQLKRIEIILEEKPTCI